MAAASVQRSERSAVRTASSRTATSCELEIDSVSDAPVNPPRPFLGSRLHSVSLTRSSLVGRRNCVRPLDVPRSLTAITRARSVQLQRRGQSPSADSPQRIGRTLFTLRTRRCLLWARWSDEGTRAHAMTRPRTSSAPTPRTARRRFPLRPARCTRIYLSRAAGDTIMGRLGRRVKDGVYGLGGVRLWNSDISCNSSPSGYRPVSRCT